MSLLGFVSTGTRTIRTYDGSEWWGTITLKNNGPAVATGFVVEFDVPAGVHCTNDFRPPGATLSPLTGSGTSARTVSNHCVFTWTTTTSIAVGASKTFNYSTDSQNFSAASNVVVSSAASCTICSPEANFSITQNSYDGSEWWGTIRFKNNGPAASSNYQVDFDVPPGVHCTADFVPPGATLSPLTGSGSSARTVSNHCVFRWTNGPTLSAGASKTFNYSTDSQSFSSAANVQATSAPVCH